MAAEHLVEGQRVQDVGMERVLGRLGPVVVDPPSELLRPQAEVDRPLVVPAGAQGVVGHSSHEIQHVSHAEGDEARLAPGSPIGVARIERRALVDRLRVVGPFEAEEDEAGGEEGLVGEVELHVGGEVPGRSNVAMRGPEARRIGRSVLDGEPVVVPDHVVEAGAQRPHVLEQADRAEGRLLPEELRHVGADLVPRRGRRETSWPA